MIAPPSTAKRYRLPALHRKARHAAHILLQSPLPLRVLFLTQWFEPEPAFKGASFAAALIAEGMEVEVATAFPNYPGGKLYPGYRITPYRRDRRWAFPVHRLPIWPSHDRSSIGRILNYTSFFLSSLIFGLFTARRFDAIYVYHPPVTPALAVAIFGAVHRRPFIVEIQDLWPDSVLVSGMGGATIPSILGKICDYVYRRASLVIAQSDGMKTRLAERGVPIAKLRRLYNWSTYVPASPTETPVEIDRWDDDAINFVYGGNLGQAQSLSFVVDAFIRARSTHENIRLHLFGDGIERDLLARQIAADGSDHILLHDSVSRAKMDRIFDRADGLVLHLNSESLYDITIPSKLQHYLSVGKPILAGLSGEAAAMLQVSGAAIVCPPQDADALAAAVKKIATLSDERRAEMGTMARAFYDRHLGMERAVGETAGWLREVATSNH